MHKKFFDIKHPGQKSPTPRIVRVPANLPYLPLKKNPEPLLPKPRLKIPLIATAAVFVIVIAIFGFNVLRFKKYATDSAPVIYDRFKAGASALFNFRLGEARQSFQEVSSQLENLNNHSPIKSLPDVLENLFKLSQNSVSLSTTLEDLKTNGLAMLINNKGAFLIDRFRDVKNNVAAINKLSDLLRVQASSLGYKLDQEFSGVNSKLTSAEEFLASLINWLEVPKKQRILVFFQNPSEIRPAGGFIGSYANATIFQGNLLELEVRDIYDPDGQLDVKVVPPKPLQGITDKWGARDANWFFDFPASAQKVIEFLEASKIYSERGVKFSGAVAVNIEAIKDILEVIGPIELKDYKLTIGPDNFLKEIQKEVENGADKAQGDPKKILKVLTPMVFEKLAALNNAQKESLLEKLANRFRQKDLMVYFKDKTIENYFKELGVAGEVVDLPKNFTGDYLAVVNSNIAGGKSDAFIAQNIKLESKVDKLGKIKNYLTVERSHNGKNEKDWWYRATNRDYLQILVTPESKLLKMKGATEKEIKPLINYKEKNFSTDALLQSLEKTNALVFGKTVFPAWLDVKAGATGKLELDYERPGRINLAAGSYQFIFEKQSGVNTGVEFSIEAPEGYIWQESNSRIFRYSGNNLASRLVISLTPTQNP